MTLCKQRVVITMGVASVLQPEIWCPTCILTHSTLLAYLVCFPFSQLLCFNNIALWVYQLKVYGYIIHEPTHSRINSQSVTHLNVSFLSQRVINFIPSLMYDPWQHRIHIIMRICYTLIINGGSIFGAGHLCPLHA